MKKFILITCLLFISFFAFSQELTVSAANKRTAQRCLSLAENYILKNAYESALSQAELGLSYDDSVSDLYYIKAASENQLKRKRAQILKTIEEGIQKDNWINNNKNNARILYADLLSDTCKPQQSLDILNQAPLIYSADAEFIRIKNYYRLGTSDSIAEARQRVDTARRIYPKDERFPYLFFMFETLFYNDASMKNLEYEISDTVKRIARDYLNHLPDYKTNRIQMEVMASMFASKEEQARLLRATGEKTSDNCMYALAALRGGVMSEEKAFNLFFDNADNSYDLAVLESFAELITDEALKVELVKHLESMTGTLWIDENLDLLPEFYVSYDRGRATVIAYDADHDGNQEVYAQCDFGVPLILLFNEGEITLNYDIYPYVNNVCDSSSGETVHYSFVGMDFIYSPFDMRIDPVFARLDLEFYVPYVSDEYAVPERSIMLLNTNEIIVPVNEREGATASYSMIAGKPYSIMYRSKEGNRYAWAITQEDFPFVRYVDYDNDNILETSEYYKADENLQFQSDNDQQILKKIFGVNLFNQPFYLSQIKIDRNNDGISEFSETYLEDGGKISSWDNDGNGIWDYEFIRYPSKDGIIIQDTIFYDDKGMEYVCVTDSDGVPQKIVVNKKEMPVINGFYKNIYWIGAKESAELEQEIVKQSDSKLSIGVVIIVSTNNKERFNVIKIGANIFIKKVSPSDADLNIMTKEYSNE